MKKKELLDSEEVKAKATKRLDDEKTAAVRQQQENQAYYQAKETENEVRKGLAEDLHQQIRSAVYPLVEEARKHGPNIDFGEFIEVHGKSEDSLEPVYVREDKSQHGFTTFNSLGLSIEVHEFGSELGKRFITIVPFIKKVAFRRDWPIKPTYFVDQTSLNWLRLPEKATEGISFEEVIKVVKNALNEYLIEAAKEKLQKGPSRNY